MLDVFIKPRLVPLMDKLAVRVSAFGLSANKITLIGFALGFAGCFFVGMQNYGLGLILILLGRVLDGVDGAVAKATQVTDLGVFLDTLCDFLIFAAFPFFFIMGQPEHSMAAAFLLFSYLFMGMAYLSHHMFAIKKGMFDSVKGGIVENTEMILFMTIVCLYPQWFSAVGAFFGLMCCATAFLRVIATLKTLKS